MERGGGEGEGALYFGCWGRWVRLNQFVLSHFSTPSLKGLSTLLESLSHLPLMTHNMYMYVYMHVHLCTCVECHSKLCVQVSTQPAPSEHSVHQHAYSNPNVHAHVLYRKMHISFL